jgi:signal peptidase I
MSEAPIETAPAEVRPAEKQPESWWATARFILGLFLLALFLRSFIVAPFSIPSGSMLPRLMIGDYLFVSKWSYGYSRYSLPFGLTGFQGRILGGLPERGDVVVFRYPGADEDFVKRVIGLPGDTIEVREGVVILNGQPLQRQRIADYAMPISPNSPCRNVAGEPRVLSDGEGGEVCAYPRFRETLPGGRSYDVLDQMTDSDGDNFGPIQVPEGQLFVMGDNRDDSLDSRFAVDKGGVGLLPIDNLLGEVLVTFWSTNGSAEWLKPWTWFSANRWGRLG